jgi:hypothetical protein
MESGADLNPLLPELEEMLGDDRAIHVQIT